MSFAVAIPGGRVQEARAALANAGLPYMSFRIPGYTDTSYPTVALMHGVDPTLRAIVESVEGVSVVEHDGDPRDAAAAALGALGAAWGGHFPVLPETGMVEPGYYQHSDATQWRVIQAFDRSVWGGHPNTLEPSLIRVTRDPYRIERWRQPIDQYDAYLLHNPITGEPDRVRDADGNFWYVTEGDAQGLNVWKPDEFGWRMLGSEPEEPEEPGVEPWREGETYAVGDIRNYEGRMYRCRTAHTAHVGVGWNPHVTPSLWEIIE